MLIWQPCPACGRCPYRPAHVQQEHRPEVENLTDLREWADEQAAS